MENWGGVLQTWDDQTFIPGRPSLSLVPEICNTFQKLHGAESFLKASKFLSLSRNSCHYIDLKCSYCVHKSLPDVPSLSQMNHVSLKAKLILSSCLCLSLQNSSFLQVLQPKLCTFSLLSCVCCMLHPALPPSYDHLNNNY